MSDRPAADCPILVLIGPPGAGKTQVAKRVARLLGVAFIDTDRVIARAHGPIATIFEQHGEEHFRAVEQEVVAKALTEAAVVSLGGGAVVHAETRARLRECRVVLLTVSPEAVARRIAGGRRPLFADLPPVDRVQAWRKIVESRRSIYESAATKTWDTSTRPVTLIAQEIAEWASLDAAEKSNT